MILIGDIGNSETKICLVNSNNNIIKRYSFKTKFIQTPSLNKYLSKFRIKSNNIKISLCA